MAHTPGPWQALPATENMSRWMISQVPPARNTAPFYIASVYTYEPKYTQVDAEANATLLATAPEMLTELERVRADLAILVRDQLRLEAYSFERIDALIAKARGEPPTPVPNETTREEEL